MTFNFKKKNLFLFVVAILIFSVVLKFQIDHKNEEQHQKIVRGQLKEQAEKNLKLFLDYSLKRSELQIKILTDTKANNAYLEKLALETQQIQFLQQEDFNNYEKKQNEIQTVITRKIINGLNSKDRKWQQFFRKSIKQLELVERDLNQARFKFSESAYELARKENKKAVTFLSDTALIENLNSKK